MGAMPEDEAGLRAFASGDGASILTQSGFQGLDEVLAGGNGPITIVYGPNPPPGGIVAHDSPTNDGRRWVVDSLGVAMRWDAETWQENVE